MLKISFRRGQGFELTNTARRNENRSHWYRLIGMRRWALILIVADDNFTTEYAPSDRPTDTTRRSPEVKITDPALLAQTLLDDLENGNLPGSPIRHRGEEIFLHTSGQVEGWLRTHLEQAGLIEPFEDVWEPKTDTTEETPNHV